LIFVPFFMFFAAIASMAPRAHGGPPLPAILGMGFGFMLFLPILYAVMGFIMGVIGAFIYNVVARWVGGIEVEIE